MSFNLLSYQYRRWLVAGTTFLSVGTSIGFVQYAFQAFVIPLEEEFGWSRTQINLSLSLGIASSFIAPIAGKFLDKYGDDNTLIVSADIENQINELDPNEKKNYMDMIDLKETGLNVLIKKGYNLLQLETFFTSGPEESRAWTVSKICTSL